MPVKITYVKKILRGLRYCPLPKLIDRRIEICSLETVESDIFAILGGDLPTDSRLISPKSIYLEGAIAKYGIIDAEFSIANKHLESCPLIDGDTLRELGFVLSPEDKEAISKNYFGNEKEDVGLLDTLAEDAEKNEALIKLFIREDEPKTPRLRVKLPDNYFPKIFIVEDACLTNSGYVWFNKHFYM